MKLNFVTDRSHCPSLALWGSSFSAYMFSCFIFIFLNSRISSKLFSFFVTSSSLCHPVPLHSPLEWHLKTPSHAWNAIPLPSALWSPSLHIWEQPPPGHSMLGHFQLCPHRPSLQCCSHHLPSPPLCQAVISPLSCLCLGTAFSRRLSLILPCSAWAPIRSNCMLHQYQPCSFPFTPF